MADKKQEPVAQNVTTVWVDGSGKAKFAEKLNEMRAEPEARGWKFADSEIYMETGDMQGVFVTCVR